MSTPTSEETQTHPTLSRRIAVLGITASGKSTLARHLARLLGVPHIELDGIVHGPNWVDLPNDVFHARTAEALRGHGWVVDGNYSAVRDLTIGQAETVIGSWALLVRPLPCLIRRAAYAAGADRTSPAHTSSA